MFDCCYVYEWKLVQFAVLILPVTKLSTDDDGIICREAIVTHSSPGVIIKYLYSPLVRIGTISETDSSPINFKYAQTNDILHE